MTRFQSGKPYTGPQNLLFTLWAEGKKDELARVFVPLEDRRGGFVEVEELAMHRGGSRSGAAVQEDHGHAVHVARLLVVHAERGIEVEHAARERLDRREKWQELAAACVFVHGEEAFEYEESLAKNLYTMRRCNMR